ncbi:LysE family translocator [Streptomyces sp. NPDC057702]|uniref:LysE family translocator n=1 Tax=unclassified Streptomyces TaxID=2593676 RepID=UPI003679551F
MVGPYAVAGFLVALLPRVATPGASLALLVQHVTDGGRRRARPVILGIVTGLYVHAALAAVGLSALVTHSSVALAAVKLIGAAYLVALGVRTWRSATPPDAHPHRRRPARPAHSGYAPTLLANALHPKAAAVHLTLAPVHRGPAVLRRPDPDAGHRARTADRALARGLDPPHPARLPRPARAPLPARGHPDHDGDPPRPRHPEHRDGAPPA